MPDFAEIIVLGLGANGSSALYHLSKTRKKLIGIDRFTPPHDFGSSHGESRIIRQAYHENTLYVPYVKEAYNYWYQLEKEADKKLLLKTGGIMLGHQNASVVTGSMLSAETYNIAYEHLNNQDLQKRFPAFKPTESTVGVLETEAGILFPEECIKTNLELAKRNGADLRLNETVLNIKLSSDKVEVITTKGTYYGDKLIVSAGAWISSLLPELQLPLTVERQVLYWFKNSNAKRQAALIPKNLPVYIWEYLPGEIFYGFPDLGNGLKIARHHAGERIEPDKLSQRVSDDEINDMKELAGECLNIEAIFNYSSVCMYTNTPDENFIIDYHPEYKNVIIASPCSGHGFKFSSFTGKLLSDMATGETPVLDISPFRIARKYV